jgi:glycosyltransferase involved in cell wall biosynthesis
MKRLPIICQLLHGLTVGGAEVLVARLARSLRDRYRFHFICLDELGKLGEELRQEGFPVEVLGRRPGVDWRLPLRLARLLARKRTALIHAHQYTPFFYALAARLLYRRPPVLFTEHGRWLPDYPRRKRIVANRLLLQRRDRVLGVGEALRQALIVNEGIPGHRVGVIYNGIDLAPYATAPVDRSSTRRDMQVNEADFVLIQVARLVPIKDHLTALRTVKQVAASLPQVRLVIVGEGSEEPILRQSITENGLAEHVRLLGLRSDVARLLSAADVFLLSSLNEGIPLTVIEAMAAGLPVVSTDVGGVAEVVRGGQTGLLAPAGDAGALARQVLQLAADAELRRRLGQAGRERAFVLFSEEKMLNAYDRLYREMLRG